MSTVKIGNKKAFLLSPDTFVDGVFIDTENVIKSTTSFTSSMSYTATDDCCIAFYIVGKQSADGLIKIDNKKVGGFFASSIEGFSCAYYLKKGQTITVTNAHASYSSDYTVYGIQTGTKTGVPTHHYSTDEQVIGTWIDGSTLYEKVVHFQNVTFDTQGSAQLDFSGLGSDLIMVDSDSSFYIFTYQSTDYKRMFEKIIVEEPYVYIYGTAGRLIDDGYITVKYTKSS